MQKSREAIIAASFFGEKNNMMWFVLKGGAGEGGDGEEACGAGW